MSAADKAKEIVQDLTGMWWPEGDEDELREAARAWRTFADDVKDITSAAHKSAQDVIDNNKGQSIDAFENFWRKYHGGGKGYLDDVASAAEDMAKALDKFADQIADAKKKIEHELEIAGAVLVAGTALALFTGGISEVAAVGATEAIVAAASTAGIAVSATVAEIAGTVLATAAIGGIEAITVDVVVAQGGRNLLGEQHGINLAEIKDAGTSGILLGGALGGAGRAAKAVGDAGGFKNAFGKMNLDGLGNLKNPLHNFEISMPNLGGSRFAMAGGGPIGPAGRPLMRNAEGAAGAGKSAGSGGRSSWEAAENVTGAARGKTLRAPHPRHFWSGVKRGPAKEPNTVVLPGHNEAIKQEIADIAAGKARWNQEAQVYEINGRSYTIEPSGTVFPKSGPGLVTLTRAEYGALGAVMRANGDLSQCEKFFANAKQFQQEPGAVQKAIELWRTYNS
ncbi:WXG100 family type VII secretion target [Streptomyces sp. NPDC048516]|uniref:WXG100 family type VII secretion target n=1 Tax=Streptomyces sp. NPDC048516 TaxID=3365565 RepID=UPI00371F4B82